MENKSYYDEHGGFNPGTNGNIGMEKNGSYGNEGYVSDTAGIPDKQGEHMDAALLNLGKPGSGDFVVDKIPMEEEEDPWKVTSISQKYTPWEELSTNGKVLRVIGYVVKIILVLAALYMFICSLDFLSSAFKLLGGEAAGRVFQQNDILTNPVAGLMMGVLVTVLVQSSSTSTSIVVSMVGAGILEIRTAIPIVMGANIGTSVTNTIVALGQISDKGEFRRAFAGATVHDMFNWLSVLILLPIEIATGFLYRLSGAIVQSLPLPKDGDKSAKKDILKVITKPFTNLIIQVNKNAIQDIAKNKDPDFDQDHAIMKVCCDKTPPKKCCDKAIGNLGGQEEYKFLNYVGIDYNITNERSVCESEELRECVKRDSNTKSPGTCESAWSFGNVTETLKKPWIDCSIFQGSAEETQQCKDYLENPDPSPLNQTMACAKFSTIFSSVSRPFDMTFCTNSWKDVEYDFVQERDHLSCVRWARDVEQKTCNKECDFLFKGLYPDLNDKEIGAILLVISLAILCICLVCMVKLLHSLLRGPMAVIIKKFVNSDFPGVLSYFTGYLAIIIGAGLTIVVQSSSIFTSTLTPLVGIGVIELDRMYPLTLGSNIGTTTTAILSALANSGDKLFDSLQVAFCHLFFNITGIVLFYPIVFLRFPIPLAKFLGNRTAEYRWFAIVYIFFMFFILPATVFALSIPGWYVLAVVMGPICILLIIIAIIKVIQAKAPKVLPSKLQNWKFLPKALRSLEPYDRIMMKVFFCKRFRVEKDQPSNSPSSNDTKNTRL